MCGQSVPCSKIVYLMPDAPPSSLGTSITYFSQTLTHPVHQRITNPTTLFSHVSFAKNSARRNNGRASRIVSSKAAYGSESI